MPLFEFSPPQAREFGFYAAPIPILACSVLILAYLILISPGYFMIFTNFPVFFDQKFGLLGKKR